MTDYAESKMDRSYADADATGDDELVERSKAGDMAAFDSIVRRYQERIFRLAFRLVGDFDEASDVAQETFIKAHQNLTRFRGQARFLTWIYRIALNESNNCLRRNKLRRFISFSSLHSEQLTPASSWDSSTPVSLPDAEVESAQLRQQAQAAIDRLPARQRRVFILRHYEGLSHGAISSIVGCTEGAVRASYFQAVRKLQLAMKDLL